jgi:hypothetical protein
MLPPQGGYMTKIKLLGGALIAMMVFTTSCVTSAEQVYAKSAPTATELSIPKHIMYEDKMNDGVVQKKDTPPCKNWLVKVLHKTGFRGKNLREAWAIVMRESGGREDAISATGDYGMFQFNKAAWGRQKWWKTDLMLTREYNAAVAFEISDGGRTWYPWDIDGKGRHKAGYTSKYVYNKYVSWYEKYPCVKRNT